MTPAKVGIYSDDPVGPALVAAYLAVGVARAHHRDGVIVNFNTRHESDEPLQRFAGAHGVRVVTVRARSFVDLVESLFARDRQDYCAAIFNCYDDPYFELVESYRDALKLHGRKLLQHHRDEIASMWGGWVRTMRESRLHCFAVGRRAITFDESGEIAAPLLRGNPDAAHEPDLLLDVTRRSRRSARITVLADRLLGLTGSTAPLPIGVGLNPVHLDRIYKPFAPYFAALAAMPPAEPLRVGRSASLFADYSTESAFLDQARERTIAAEELAATLEIIWPGQTAVSKTLRAAAIEGIFGSRSWTEVEGLPAAEIRKGVGVLRECEIDVSAPTLKTRGEVLDFIQTIRTVGPSHLPPAPVEAAE